MKTYCLVDSARDTAWCHMQLYAETEHVLNRADACILFMQVSTLVHAAPHVSMCVCSTDRHM